ncbi:unnamed protein product [Parascedosporium putredinis]|uniref:PNPLA domain-containing protein n=1 Tax=Parascedosporium putredinis TaxID=1442378 RepID=A0A9P1H0C3_9PEZI|nr:unnamed protein product [Parascedosporium putredinis]CAI7993759.1 unnamed protein product [Parascedosporium putredinis]
MMDQAMANIQLTGGVPNPVDQSGLCLLSLDGGGVRGLSTLGILKGIMSQLNRKPCEVFDLIGGTSTGGRGGITRLRSYGLPEKPNIPVTIREAALATSAATGFFDPGLQDIGLAEYKEQGNIMQATDDYLDHQDRVFAKGISIADLFIDWAPHDLEVNVQNFKDACIHNQTGVRFYLIPFPRNLQFVGRKGLVDELTEKLFISNSSQTIALFGLGGVGKTQVALQLAYWVKQNRPDYSVFWVSALSYPAFEQSYAEIEKRLDYSRTPQKIRKKQSSII